MDIFRTVVFIALLGIPATGLLLVLRSRDRVLLSVAAAGIIASAALVFIAAHHLHPLGPAPAVRAAQPDLKPTGHSG